MKRFNVQKLEKPLLFLASVSMVVFLTTSLACGQEREEDPIQGTIKVERGANLQALAKISSEEARTAALARFAGSSVEEIELENEDGFLVYEIELMHNGEEMEVLVDAGDASILRFEGEEDSEDEDDNIAEEDEEDGDEEDEDDDEIGEGVELPGAVESAFGAAYPNAKMIGSDMEEKDGVTYFEIESRDGTVERNLLYLPDGTLYETEEVVAVESVPAKVRSAAEAHGRIVKAERITRGTTTEYEIRIQAGDEEHELLLDQDGQVIEKSQEDEEED